jgi:putative ABC transport system substrate-binding protein
VDRRTFVAGTVAFLAAPLAGEAQQAGKVVRIGVLRTDSGTVNIDRLREGLRDLGWVEGRDYVLEARWAEGRLERLPALAADLVRLKVDVIVTHGPPAIRAAMAATRTIPIVMGRMDDADAHGFVQSLARPGGNVTGLSFQSGDLAGKWLELLREAVPRLSRVAVLWDSTGTRHQVETLETAARALSLHPHVLEVQTPRDYEKAFEAARTHHDQGVVILASPVLSDEVRRLADMAARSRLPSVYYLRAFAEAGGLLAYGPGESDFTWRRAAFFVDKILKGAKPADLPVEQPTKFVLVINLKTAKALGLTIPQSVLMRADEVIQ